MQHRVSFDGSEYRSSLDRSRDELALLSTYGREIHGLNLQSYLFFGSANRLYEHVQALLQHHSECRYLILDFKLVTGIDSSAAYSFAQIKRTALERNVKLILVHLPPAAEKVLRSSQFISGEIDVIPELDHALEWCENQIIKQHRSLEEEEGNLRDWLAKILGDENDAEELMDRCQRIEVSAGDVIARAGDAADAMHFIVAGRVGIMVSSGDERTTRVRSLGRYTTVGEMELSRDSRVARLFKLKSGASSMLCGRMRSKPLRWTTRR